MMSFEKLLFYDSFNFSFSQISLFANIPSWYLTDFII